VRDLENNVFAYNDEKILKAVALYGAMLLAKAIS